MVGGAGVPPLSFKVGWLSGAGLLPRIDSCTKENSQLDSMDESFAYWPVVSWLRPNPDPPGVK